MNKPIIAITMGDAAGIGPEIIVKALINSSFENYYPIVIGDADVLKNRMEMFKISGEINIISEPVNLKTTSKTINCIDLKNIFLSELKIGSIQKMCGEASVQYIFKAVELAKKNIVNAIVTAPICKEAMNKAGHMYPGHTELLAKLTRTKKYAMMLSGNNLRVVLVTIHIALNKVSQNISKTKIEEKIKLTYDFLTNYLNIKNPKIAICGLNPHSGEGGLFGNEEKVKIIPAIEAMKKKQMDISGPYPADTLFYYAKDGIYDAVIVMYHDQGLIPLKMLYMDSGINITLGLPIIRTSPDHGTAFDIAEKGIASYSSLESAIKLASMLAKNKKI